MCNRLWDIRYDIDPIISVTFLLVMLIFCQYTAHLPILLNSDIINYLTPLLSPNIKPYLEYQHKYLNLSFDMDVYIRFLIMMVKFNLCNGCKSLLLWVSEPEFWFFLQHVFQSLLFISLCCLYMYTTQQKYWGVWHKLFLYSTCISFAVIYHINLFNYACHILSLWVWCKKFFVFSLHDKLMFLYMDDRDYSFLGLLLVVSTKVGCLLLVCDSDMNS